PAIPQDLETICLKCLEKEPGRRYPSAQALAEELSRFLRSEPIRARPIRRIEKVGRWCGRHRAVTALIAVAAALTVLLAVVSTFSAARLKRANLRAREELWTSYLAEARANRLSGRPGRRFHSLEVLKKAAAIHPSMELRNEAIASMVL